MLEEAKATL